MSFGMYFLIETIKIGIVYNRPFFPPKSAKYKKKNTFYSPCPTLSGNHNGENSSWGVGGGPSTIFNLGEMDLRLVFAI